MSVSADSEVCVGAPGRYQGINAVVRMGSIRARISLLGGGYGDEGAKLGTDQQCAAFQADAIADDRVGRIERTVIGVEIQVRRHR